MSFLKRWFKPKGVKKLEPAEPEDRSITDICANCKTQHYTRVCPTAPNAVFVCNEGDMDLEKTFSHPDYKDFQKEYQNNPNFEAPDLDADLAGYREEFGDPSFEPSESFSNIYEAGLAVAYVAKDETNPDYQRALHIAKLTAMDLTEIKGIAEATAQKMKEHGIRNVYDLAKYDGINKRWIKLKDIAQGLITWTEVK